VNFYAFLLTPYKSQKSGIPDFPEINRNESLTNGEKIPQGEIFLRSLGALGEVHENGSSENMEKHVFVHRIFKFIRISPKFSLKDLYKCQL